MLVSITPTLAWDEHVELSPAQVERLEAWTARFPATYFDVIGQDMWSRAMLVEIEDMETRCRAIVSANGRVRTDL